MDRRTKILAGVFAVVVAAAGVRQVLYPRWIRPYLTLDERIAEKRRVLSRLEAIKDQVERAAREYAALRGRAGSEDLEQIETDLRARLNDLIEKRGLQNVSVMPGRQRSDRKTGIESKSVTVSAAGTVESAVAFLKDLAELPHLIRVGNTSLDPVRSGRTRRKEEIVNLRVPLELIALPRHPLVDTPPDELPARPEKLVRHQQRDYAPIWSGQPFTEYVPPKPIYVDAGRDVRVPQGTRLTLRGSIRGGEGGFEYQWSPTEGLSTPNAPDTGVDTSEPFERTYSLTVTDQIGQTATASVNVAVMERVVERPKRPPEPVERKPRVVRWPGRRYMQLVMVLGRQARGERVDEVMVYNQRSRQTTYYTVGDEFDGGKLVSVHPTGALVYRNEEYAVYPIGATLDQDVDIAVAEAFPALQVAAERHRRTNAAADDEDAQSARDGPDRPGRRMRTVSERNRP